MSKKNVIKKIEKLLYKVLPSFIEEIHSMETSHDILYNANISIFTCSSINHKKRLSLLNKVRSISREYKNNFCVAHNLTLAIKVSRELGKNGLIKDSHKAIDLWKSVLDQPLAINGLIFSYTDLGLLFSDFNLNSLAIKYLDKANSLIAECDDSYNPFTKLYVAYALVYSKMGDKRKTDAHYNKVIKLAKSRNDSIILIPILVNTANDFISNEKYKAAIKRCQEALMISDKNKEMIYKPHIYHALGRIYLETRNYKECKKHFNLALDIYNKMNSVKMIPKTLCDIGSLFYKQKKYNEALNLFNDALDKNKKIDDFNIDIMALKTILSIYGRKRDSKKKLLVTNKLNKVLEKQIVYKEQIFSDTNANALKYLSEELDLSLKRNTDLKIKIDLHSKKRKLTTETLVSVSEREFLKNIIDKLSSEIIDNKKLLQLLKNRIEQTKDWNLFMKLFNDIHPYFNKYIINKCPSITESELRICNLIKMNFSSIEITDILSISKRGVEQHRYRIKKKLKLQGDLTIFLQSL